MSALTTGFATVSAALILAYALGQFTTRSIQTEITINAPADAVWASLTDGSDLSWNPFLTRLTGTLAQGEQLGITVSPEGMTPMDFTPTVLVADAGRELRWVGRLGFRGIFDGEHYFVLEPLADGQTKLRHGERFSGMLTLALYPMLVKGTTSGFRAMNAALRERVEE